MFYKKIVVALLLLAFFCKAHAGEGELLRSAMIWHPDDASRAVGFRKIFNCKTTTTQASLCIFADSRYMLWINGRYVMRGPCRFDPQRPEYDSMDVARYLHHGENTIAVLVYGHISSGESMEHTPGLALSINAGTCKLLTGTGWRCSNTTRFGNPLVMWDGIRENVNAATEDGDWIMPGYNDSRWVMAVVKDKSLWGAFEARTTPLSVSTDVPFTINGKKFPFEIKGPADLHLQLEKNIMGYCIFGFDADSGAQLSVFGHHYKAKQGRQEYITADVYGSGLTNTFATNIRDEPDSVFITVHIDSGTIRFNNIRVVNFIAPLQLVGSFQSADSMLNRFWKVIANMHAQCTQDTYTDGATEGNEWVADVHNVLQFTNVAFAGKNKNGSLNFSANPFYAKALSDIALSQQAGGRIKAHHPSDRFDLHWFIEDFACMWIGDLKSYYEQTGDKKFVTRLWPVVKKQLAYFKDSIRKNNLFYGREWCIFDNPYVYVKGQGATLNAYVYKAFKDAAWLAEVCGERKTGADYNETAAKIKTAFNNYFWNAYEGNFMGMIDSAVTIHAAVLSLYTGICADEHKSDAEKWLLKRKSDSSVIYPFLHLFWFKALYDMNSNEADQQVLDIIHAKYSNKWNAYNKGYLTSEGCNFGRNFHNFGMAPGYFLSAYVLGVRMVEPAWKKQIVIEPRLGNLPDASGKVATVFGTVNVAWHHKPGRLNFSFTVPKGVTAKVGIPVNGKASSVVIDGKVIVQNGKALVKGITITDRFVYLKYNGAAVHSGYASLLEVDR